MKKSSPCGFFARLSQLFISSRLSIAATAVLFFLILVVLPGVAQSQSADAAIAAGLAEIRSKNYSGALETFRNAATRHPRNARLLALLGLTLNRLGDYRQALDALEKAEALGAKVPTVDFEVGWSQVGLGAYREALSRLEAYEKARPGRAKTAELLGRAHLGLGNYERAEPYLRAGMAKDPALEPTSLYYLAVLEYRRGNTEAARKHLAALLQRAPDSHLAQALSREIANGIEKRIASGEPLPEGLRAEIQRWLRERDAARPWSVSFAFLTGYNDNVIGLGNDQPLPRDVSGQGSGFATLGLGARYGFRSGETGHVSLGYHLLANSYFSLHRFDSQEHVLSAAYGEKLSNRMAAAIQAYGGYLRIDEDGFRRQAGLRPSLAYRWSRVTTSEISYRYTKDNYLFVPVAAVFDRDGHERAFGLVQRYELPRSRTIVALTADYLDNAASGSDFSYRGIGVGGHVSRTFAVSAGGQDWRVVGRAGLSYFRNDYDNNNSLAGTGFSYKRADRVSRFYAALTVPIRQGMAVTAYYNFTENASNIGLYDYMQHVGGVGASLQF